MTLTMRRKVLLVAVVLIVLIPVRVTCGTAAMHYVCMPAPDSSGYVNIYFEVEPLGIAVVEFLAGTNIPIYYYAGYHHRRVIP
jgi:NO-binding membrane sensor protein with MHYT domain